MADITNPQAVRFCNEKVRPMADVLSETYFTCKSIIAEWNAQGFGSVLLFSNTTDHVVDGSLTDGRPLITPAQVNNIITRCTEFVADYEAGSNAKLNTVLQVRVNGQPIF